jgi:hypothetical protein
MPSLPGSTAGAGTMVTPSSATRKVIGLSRKTGCQKDQSDGENGQNKARKSNGRAHDFSCA